MEYHTPVLLKQTMDVLKPKSSGIYLDATLGGGGHSLEILKISSPDGRVIGLDMDQEALKHAGERLSRFGNRVLTVHENFKNARKVLDSLGIQYLDGAVMDLGVSSHQIDEASRGFSYTKDAKLDMRMDQTQSLTAYEVVNTYPQKKLEEILYLYGEETYAKKIAANIAKARAIAPIVTTLELADIISKSVPLKQYKHGHPAKKTFQAIRIEVNQELEGLEQAVKDIIDRLKKGGIIAVITFHSLEDRIIKRLFKKESTDCVCDKSLPVCSCNHKATIKLLTKKPILPVEEEIKQNSRAASAKLRAACRL
ncbi:MAG: 16S rRNA (cytosine(1402)-N(4))-methyltransferase RsmH [Clostridiales bacterium]|nr:16S rRNA (cytosine(1402)-N(4))-methyltransferase RsmH [Clostridiales bacterium]